MIAEQKFTNTSSKPIIVEEVSRNWMELLSLSQGKLIILLQRMHNFDEFNYFCTWKVSMRWKNWNDFKALHSMNFREEDWSKIETPSLNSQERFRNYRMKKIAWMIREIFKMLNQYAVDNPTLPVNQSLSHLIQILVECKAVLLECRAAEKGRQVFATHMVYRETFLQLQRRLLQHFIRKGSILGILICQNTHHRM